MSDYTQSNSEAYSFNYRCRISLYGMCALTAGFDTEELAFRLNGEGLFEPGSVCELNRRRLEDNAWHALKLSVGTLHLSERAAVSHCTLTWAEILVFTLTANKEQQH